MYADQQYCLLFNTMFQSLFLIKRNKYQPNIRKGKIVQIFNAFVHKELLPHCCICQVVNTFVMALQTPNRHVQWYLYLLLTSDGEPSLEAVMGSLESQLERGLRQGSKLAARSAIESLQVSLRKACPLWLLIKN